MLTLSQVQCERDDRVLFTDLSATFSEGDIIQIAGPNGAGKTTLLRVLSGLSQHFEGDIRWGDYQHSDYEYSASLLYLGHATGVNLGLTPVENLQWYFGLNGIKSRGSDSLQIPTHSALLDALNTVGLAGYDDVPCHQMSAGQKRRVALARLYLSDAPIWILDEPFTAIDVKGADELETRIAEHAQSGGVIILTTHQPLAVDGVRVIDLGEYQPEVEL